MQKTNIVVSTMGRDKGKIFVVIDTYDGYVYLADGKGRGILNPKRKKLKHCSYKGESPERLMNKFLQGEKITNNEIRTALSEFTEKLGDQEPEGVVNFGER